MDRLNLPTYQARRSVEFYHSLPKVELHRHLEGSLRFETVRELARAHGMDLPATQELRGMVQIQEDEPLNFQNFLSKFSTLRLFYRSPEIIGRITREAIADAASDNVRYLELRFTPAALSKAQGFPLAQVMDWVIEGARQAEIEFGVITRLIASVNRHEGLPLAAQVSYLAAERQGGGIVGLDLAGDEMGYPAGPFAKIFRSAQQKGLHITVHAGEWSTGENITQAIEELGAERIGHGARVLESSRAIDLALERGTAFESCVTSNYQSGVVADVSAHPLPLMLSEGLNVTINTDDPSISQIDLSNEYRLVCEEFGLTLFELRQRVLSAARAAFLSDEERQRLVDAIAQEFPSEPPS
jgi:adenosine deaminase